MGGVAARRPLEQSLATSSRPVFRQLFGRQKMGSFSPFDPAQPTILTVPGLGGSGPSHWQTLWESSRPDTVRVELGMWNTPHRNAWVTKLDQAIRQAQAPVILAAHSMGCLAVAWWAELTRQPYGWPVAGALLVAPADADRAKAQPELKAFGPTPTTPALSLDRRREPRRSMDRARPRAQPGRVLGQPFRRRRRTGPSQCGERHRLVERRAGIARTGYRRRQRQEGQAARAGRCTLDPGNQRDRSRAGTLSRPVTG